MKYTKKSGKWEGQKISKLEKLKSKKMFKFQNLAESGKKLLKSENLPNFDVMKARSKFLTSNIKTTFNYLWLVFTKALIFKYFNLKYYILIKIDISNYTISRALN